MSQVSTLFGGFTYETPVSVLAVIPTTGPTVGGLTVTVIGSQFRAGASVTFGGVGATSVSVLDTNHISCIPPAHAVGAVNVTVINTTGLYPTGTLVNGYTYYAAPPTVTAIKPKTGGTAGSEAVIIT